MIVEKNPQNELTHLIIGVLYDVYNELGYGYQEKHYYRAIKNGLLAKDLKVNEQLLSNLTVADKIIGRFYLDFLIQDQIVLEIKVANAVYPQHIKQVLNYLKANNLKLGLVGVISKGGVIVKRVAN